MTTDNDDATFGATNEQMVSSGSIHGGPTRRRQAVTTSFNQVMQQQSRAVRQHRHTLAMPVVDTSDAGSRAAAGTGGSIMREGRSSNRSSAGSMVSVGSHNVRFSAQEALIGDEEDAVPTSLPRHDNNVSQSLPRTARQPKFETAPIVHPPSTSASPAAPPTRHNKTTSFAEGTAGAEGENRTGRQGASKCCTSFLNCFVMFFTLGMGPNCGGQTPAERNKRALENMLRVYQSKIWQGLRIFGAFVLIFGPAIQILFTKRADIYFFVLFLVVLLLLVADMVICCCVHPNYFLWKFPCLPESLASRKYWCCATNLWQRTSLPLAGAAATHAPTVTEKGRTKRHFQFGSFMFWLDLISTVSFLPEVFFSSVNTMTIDHVTVNAAGVPIDHAGLSYELLYVDSLHVFYIIGRTARLARFVRPDMAVKLSSYFHWYSIKAISQDLCSWLVEGRWLHWLILKSLVICDCCCLRGRCERMWKQEEAARVIQRAYRKHIGSTAGPANTSRRLKSMRKDRMYRNSMGGGVRSSLINLSRLPSALSEKVDGSNSIQRHRRRISKYNKRSQVGAAMRELTAQRIALLIMVALIASVAFLYRETNITPTSVTVMLHSQTTELLEINILSDDNYYMDMALESARLVQPMMYRYVFANGTSITWDIEGYDVSNLRESEKLSVIVGMKDSFTTSAFFITRQFAFYEALSLVVSETFIVILWVLGITGFAGPIMTLVVTPIERMIRLLEILTRDPLGYQTTPRFHKFVEEEYEIAKMTSWSTDVLSGMETSFLMSTILRIGSLMRVGFGSAGVEIIRNNLNSSTSRNSLAFDQTGSTVSCIFLFCDIRQFTDATEALQEEVFVFTNRIAGVVHSICSAYGGSANKNIGDAFLLSWRLDETRTSLAMESTRSLGSSWNKTKESSMGSVIDKLVSKGFAADRALYSVIKVCQALVHDNYFLEQMSNHARSRLLGKLKGREGPAVQIGFGLHAGEAVQGAIGSHRKIDATYLSETVDRSETLESLTKRYGVKVLMSRQFHELLSNSTRRKCRKVDQILVDEIDEEGLSGYDAVELGITLELFTYDFDVDVGLTEKLEMRKLAAPRRQLSRRFESKKHLATVQAIWEDDCEDMVDDQNFMARMKKRVRATSGTFSSRSRSNSKASRRSSIDSLDSSFARGKRINEVSIVGGFKREGTVADTAEPTLPTLPPQLQSASAIENGSKVDSEITLPTGPAEFSSSVWVSEEMKLMRVRYTDGMFFNSFDSGLRSYFAGNWVDARQCFALILERLKDGPSIYFMKLMEENNWRPPRNFTGYGCP